MSSPHTQASIESLTSPEQTTLSHTRSTKLYLTGGTAVIAFITQTDVCAGRATYMSLCTALNKQVMWLEHL